MAIQPERIGPIDIRAAFKPPTGLAFQGGWGALNPDNHPTRNLWVHSRPVAGSS